MTAHHNIVFSVNGVWRELRLEPRRLLVHCLRDDLGLTGAHVGCETGQCGACVVVLNGRPVKSCNLLAVQADRAAVLTIEGLAPHGQLHPLQDAFCEAHAVQCGFCTPGMIMTASCLLQSVRRPSGDQIRAALYGNLCRCTGYENIVKAIARAGEQLDPAGDAP